MKKYLFLISLAFLSPSLAGAYTGQFVVDTKGESINAIEAVVHIPTGINIQNINTGHSAVLIWIQSPQLDNNARTISFSGISPGGFQGKQDLFSFTGDLTEGDLSRFQYSAVSAYKNDGSGSSTPVEISAIPAEIPQDISPPEPFKPVIGSSQDLFNGQRFVSFATQDKDLGVSKYEFASTWLFNPSGGDWQVVTSPQELKSLDLFKKIYIRASDSAGNYRIGEINGPYYYATLIFGTIIIVCVLLFSIILKRRSFF